MSGTLSGTMGRSSSNILNNVIYIATLGLFFLLGYRYGQNSSFSSLTLSQSPKIRTYPKVELDSSDYNRVFMSREEVDTIIRYLPRKGTYIEWGSGGSTIVFTKFVKTAYSIEHVNPWCRKVKHDIMKYKLDNIRYFCVPVKKPNGEYYTNENEGNYKLFQNYVDFVKRFGQNKKYDFVLIDGRARIAVALRVLPYLKETSIVALHDTVHRKDEYSEVLNHYDVIEQVVGNRNQGVSILRRKDKYRHNKNLPIHPDYIHNLYKYLPS